MKHYSLKLKKTSQIQEILSNDYFYVRPKNEVITSEIQRLLVGNILSNMIRMRDDKERDNIKSALVMALAQFSQNEISTVTKKVINLLKPELINAENLNIFLRSIAICVIGYFLGYHKNQWQQLIKDTCCLSQSIIANKNIITDEYQHNISSQAIYTQIQQQDSLLKSVFFKSAKQNGIEDEHVLICNLIGLLLQANDGTTALLGLTLLAYLKDKSANINQLIEKVLNDTPPIKRTKRYSYENSDSYQFNVPLKAEDGTLPFGHGKHSCPGKMFAITMVKTTINYINENKLMKDLVLNFHFKDSPNANIPIFSNNDIK